MKLHLTTADWTILTIVTIIVSVLSMFLLKLGWLSTIPIGFTVAGGIYAFEEVEK